MKLSPNRKLEIDRLKMVGIKVNLKECCNAPMEHLLEDQRVICKCHWCGNELILNR